MWWNVASLTPLLVQAEFWDLLEGYDIIFLLETHHTEIPHRDGWRFVGTPGSKAGGVLAVIREGTIEIEDVAQPFDGFVWIKANSAWIGGVYLPGPSDVKYRSLQGSGKTDHFASLAQQLDDRRDDPWLLGGDFNSMTAEEQPQWGAADLLDHIAPNPTLPARSSEDLRPVSTHGRRLLRSLADRGIICNGIKSKCFPAEPRGDRLHLRIARNARRNAGPIL